MGPKREKNEEELRNQYSAQFKAEVAVEAIKGHKMISELASEYGVHPNQNQQWKQQALEELPHVFSDGRARARRTEQELKAQLYQQIGQLTIGLEWLRKSRTEQLSGSEC